MTTITLTQIQHLRDIALQYYGSMVGVLWLCQDNQLPGHYIPQIGDKIKLRNQPENKNIVQYFAENTYNINSTPIV